MSTNLTVREIKLLRGVCDELFRHASSQESQEGREAIEQYAEMLAFRLKQMEKRVLNGMTYNDFLRAMAETQKARGNSHLRIVTW